MTEPYYQQDYHAQPSAVPDSSFGQIMHETFLQPFTWNARSTRKTFWIGWAVSEIIAILLLIVSFVPISISFTFNHQGDIVSFVANQRFILGLVLVICAFLLEIYLALCRLGLGVRRLHDSNRSGYFMWLDLIPSIGYIIILFFMLIPTAEIPVQWNRYLSIKK